MFSGHLCLPSDNSSWVEVSRLLLKVAHGAESWLWSDHCRVVLRNVLAAVLLLAIWDCTCLFGSLIVLLTQITVNNPEVLYCATASTLYTGPEGQCFSCCFWSAYCTRCDLKEFVSACLPQEIPELCDGPLPFTIPFTSAFWLCSRVDNVADNPASRWMSNYYSFIKHHEIRG